MIEMYPKICPTCLEKYMGPMVVCVADGTLLVRMAPEKIAKRRCVQCRALYTNRVTVCPADGFELEDIVEEIDGSSLRCFAQNYKASRVLATGRHSVVYEGKNIATNEPVALKLLKIELNEAQYAKKLSRFSGPIDIHSKLEHRNIIKIFDNGFNLEAKPYLVYELVKDGFSLSHLPGKLKLLPLEYFLAIFVQTCEALEYASEAGLIHQDLSTGDVLISEGADDSIEIKVTDFAKGAPLIHGDNRNLQMTELGDLFGHPEFMSPEVCIGEPVNTAAMIYSLGSAMYCALSETKPFDGPHWAAIMLTKFHQAPPPLAFDFGSDETEKVRGIVERCMHFDPKNRFVSISDVRTELLSLRKADSPTPKYSILKTHFTELPLN